MKAKKILSMLLVGVTALGLLAGCSSNTDDTQDTNADNTTEENQDSTADSSNDAGAVQSAIEDSMDAASGSGNVLVVDHLRKTGNTEEAANYIADATGGDLFEVEPVEPSDRR